MSPKGIQRLPPPVLPHDHSSVDMGGKVPLSSIDASVALTTDIPADTGDLPDSTDARYVTDAELVVIGNTSGANTGDVALVVTTANYATQSADEGPNTVATAAGFYIVHSYVVTTTAGGGAGSLLHRVYWTDEYGANNAAILSSHNLAVAGARTLGYTNSAFYHAGGNIQVYSYVSSGSWGAGPTAVCSSHFVLIRVG